MWPRDYFDKVRQRHISKQASYHPKQFKDCIIIMQLYYVLYYGHIFTTGYSGNLPEPEMSTFFFVYPSLKPEYWYVK